MGLKQSHFKVKTKKVTTTKIVRVEKADGAWKAVKDVAASTEVSLTKTEAIEPTADTVGTYIWPFEII